MSRVVLVINDLVISIAQLLVIFAYRNLESKQSDENSIVNFTDFYKFSIQSNLC